MTQIPDLNAGARRLQPGAVLRQYGGILIALVVLCVIILWEYP